MTFRCPRCAAGALTITTALELPADARSDEIAVQLLACRACGFTAAGVYEESRRGAPDEESWEHYGLPVESGEMSRLRELLGRCPRPGDAACNCPAHRLLGSRDAGGRWRGVEQVAEVGKRFPLER